MNKQADKSNRYAELDWHQLLVHAHERCMKNARKLSKELNIPFTTLLSWLRRSKEPRNPEALRQELISYLDKPFVSKANPSILARIWQSMRCLRKFTAGEIIALTGASANYCRQVIKLMCRCDYVRIVSQEPRTFMLVRDTGPRPPEMNKGRTALIDNNINQEAAV